jgi:hypothetical protein
MIPPLFSHNSIVPHAHHTSNNGSDGRPKHLKHPCNPDAQYQIPKISAGEAAAAKQPCTGRKHPQAVAVRA